MFQLKFRFISRVLLTFFVFAAVLPAQGMGHLEQYFRFMASGENENAVKILNDWKPKGNEEKTYKRYFMAVNENKIEKYWDLYNELSKKKKLLKLQHEAIKKIIEIDLTSEKDLTKKLKKFPKIAKKMLRNLRGQPEGVAYELSYLKWILKNKQLAELCSTERNRWLSQSTLNLSEVTLGLSSCEMTYNDFIYRIRLLIFSGEEKKAQDEIKEYVEKNKIEDWRKDYLQAVYFSNVGDPVAAFKTISPRENDLKAHDDYYLNLFYIAQRAGEQKKAEEIIDDIIKIAKSEKQISELNYQKAFLYYQTKRYKQANVLLNKLIKNHRSHNRKTKSKEYDDLTWLRAWCYYLDKDYEKAHAHLTENAAWTRDKAKNFYWLARAEWERGNQLQALEYYRELAAPVLQGKFFNYYNYISRLRFEANKSLAVSDLMRSQLSTIKSGKGQFLLPDEEANPLELADTYNNYMALAEATDQGSIQLINQENSVLESTETEGIKIESSEQLKSELAWADELTKWGYRDLAKWHLYEVEKNLKSKSDAIPLAQYYLENQHYNRAVLLMQKVTNTSSKKLNLVDEEVLWKSLFPKAFEDKIKQESKNQKIPQYLLWSIMKAETQFKTDAISPVGAVGLMQFMPYTSKKVAGVIRDDFDANKLFDAPVAIRYGASYLKKLSNELGDQMHLVAAAYNGGPHRVKLWLRNLKEEGDENIDNDAFIEHIPFNETRTYVKRVINFYLAYQTLYDEKIDLKSSQWLISKSPFKLKEPLSLKEEWPGHD